MIGPPAATSPSREPPLMGFAALQSVVCDGVARHRVPCSRLGVHRFRSALAVFRPSPSPEAFASGSSSRALSFPPESLESLPARPNRAPSLGFLPSSRRQPTESTLAGIPSPLRSALDVSHVLDGFLLCRPCGSISPRCRVQGSLFRGFPSREAVRARRPPLPSCRLPAAPAAGFPTAPVPRARLQGFLPLANPWRTLIG
jgi:hypothetical protein